MYVFLQYVDYTRGPARHNTSQNAKVIQYINIISNGPRISKVPCRRLHRISPFCHQFLRTSLGHSLQSPWHRRNMSSAPGQGAKAPRRGPLHRPINQSDMLPRVIHCKEDRPGKDKECIGQKCPGKIKPGGLPEMRCKCSILQMGKRQNAQYAESHNEFCPVLPGYGPMIW